jgi:hypothetical protein
VAFFIVCWRNYGLTIVHLGDMNATRLSNRASRFEAEAASAEGATEAGNMIFWAVFVFGLLMPAGGR